MASGRTDERGVWGVELRNWWRYYNELYLSAALREPVFRLSDGTGALGAFDRATRTLSISAEHVSRQPWLAVMETLRHEMAHQYAHEVLGATDERPHGEAFKRACARLRVDARASGLGDEVTAPSAVQQGRHDAIVERISKLLSLSASPNEHEAQVAINKARELLLKHNIDSVDLDRDRQFGVRWLGLVKGRHHHHEQILASILGDFFFVSVIWVHTYDATRRMRGTVLAAYGSGSSLQMADYVHGYLESVLDSLWSDYREDRKLRGNRERLRYFAGVLNGFRGKLESQDLQLRSRHALVWKGDPELESHVRYHHPSTRTGHAGGSVRSRAYEDGVEAGRSVTLRRPIGGSDGGFGGFLTG